MKKLGFLQVLGILLVLVSLAVCILWQRAGQENDALTQKLLAVLPQESPGTPDAYADARMPILQMDGEDYVALLEVPIMGVTLPVKDLWQPQRLNGGPCRFWGSIYDGSAIIGGSWRQFEFCSRLEPGDTIRLRDMQGTVFTCQVKTIQRWKEADYARLAEGNYPLTLFVRERISNRYIMVRCEWAY